MLPWESRFFPRWLCSGSADPIQRAKRDLTELGVYFTNAMLCFRGGSAKVGNTSISSQSFEARNGFLWEQIRLVKPQLVITWGADAARYTIQALRQGGTGDPGREGTVLKAEIARLLGRLPS